MSEGLKQLPRRKLEGFVGENLLQRLEKVLPSVSGGAVDKESIYHKESLTAVLEAFLGDKVLWDANACDALLRHQPEEVIDRILERWGIEQSERDFVHKIGLIKEGVRRDALAAEAVVEELGLDRSLIPEHRDEIPSCQVIPAPRSPYKPLKEYQYGVFREARQKLEIPRNRFVVQMPTGSGKTRTAMEVLSDYLNEAGEKTKIVWLAHSAELCEQAYVAFKEVWEHIGKEDATLARIWGSQRVNKDLLRGKCFVVASLPSLHSRKKNEDAIVSMLRDETGVIVVDEAHKATAPTYRGAIESIVGKETRVVGLTATPGRTSETSQENEQLKSFFFGEIVSIEAPIDETVIEYLQRKKVLSRAEFVPLLTGRTFQVTATERNSIEKYFDFPDGFLSRVAADDLRNIEIISRVRKEIESGRKVLMFACSVEHSQFLCGALNFLGHCSGHIDGSISYAKRRSVLDQFRAGTMKVLCNFGVLSTGFDVPEIEAIVIARPTASVVLYSQMIGRGLRGPRIGGTERCKVIDVIDNIDGYDGPDSVYEYFAEYWSESGADA